MLILGHGIDIVSISRFKETLERQKGNFLNRVFTEGERKYCQSHTDPSQHFAVRFAAKEAFGKALGVGITTVESAFQEVEVFREGNKAPKLFLRGNSKKAFVEKGGKGIHLSLSHDGNFAIASVILTKE